MREILFKAKNVATGEWVYGNYAFCDCYTKQQHYIFQNKPLEYAIDESTLCQYTGLTDKNGNKIWENDVIKTYNSSGIECHIEQIIWSDYGLNEGWCSKGIKSLMKYDKRVFNTGFGKSDARKCEVIGNIFDNPELLKGSEEE